MGAGRGGREMGVALFCPRLRACDARGETLGAEHGRLCPPARPPAGSPNRCADRRTASDRQKLASFHSAAILREPYSRGKAPNGMHVEARIERSEEHTSELPRQYLVCRLLLEKKKKKSNRILLT